MNLFFKYLLIFISVGIVGCTDVPNNDIQNITPEQMLDALFEDDVQVLDVRTHEEFYAGRIPGAQNICVSRDDFKEKVKELDKNKPVYLYCKAGGRSAKAAKLLKEMGFKEIYDMSGGIEIWKDKGMKTDSL
ncbi:MAG: rhodanese-like domain-containing protein [Flavobacteriales bacterium]|nr:rhodanese-like domain-containing protein [Flavobacteriales bacterium]